MADLAYRVIADRIITLDIRPNEAINESQLSKEMQMGRTPIREALSKLESERLVVTQPRKGSFAAPINLTDLFEVAQIRQALEPLAAGLAAGNIRPDGANKLQELLPLLDSLDSRTVDQNELMRLNLAVHHLIYEIAGNVHLADTLVRYAHLSTRIWSQILERRPPVVEQTRELAGIARAIIAKDSALSQSLMDDHVHHFNEFVASQR
ncbi:GntR family transcriptional regulator [Paenarthrobacter sp. NPDC089714]|uniref:GntR family transcriptional regulator n=1 Tax=unclassified Paenarthrobacter TaxID=2634190 RepID=UPI0038118593